MIVASTNASNFDMQKIRDFISKVLMFDLKYSLDRNYEGEEGLLDIEWFWYFRLSCAFPRKPWEQESLVQQMLCDDVCVHRLVCPVA